MTNTCVCGCGRQLLDGFAHHDCTERARQQLAEIAELVEPARAVAYRQTASDGTINGTPGPRDLIDYGAGARLIGTLNALTEWSREIAAERGILRALYLPHEDPLTTVSAWLSGHTEWIRHRGETTNPQWVRLYARIPDSDELDPDVPPFIAAQFLHTVAKAARVLHGIAAGRRERIYLGTCGAPAQVETTTFSDPEPTFMDGPPCRGSVYGSIGASKAVCKACGARYDQAARIADRSELAHGYTYTAAEIAEAYPGVVLASTIRQWRRRGLLTAHGEADGHRLYVVAEVLALVDSAKERHEQATQCKVAQAAEMGA